MTIGIGIIGTGSIADDCHAPAVKALEGLTLRGVLSRNTATGISFLKKHAGPDSAAYTEIDSFLADDRIEAVIIASPDRLHAPHALACLLAKKHVLLEKPMAISCADAESLVSTAQTTNRRLAVGFHLRQHAGHRALHKKVTEEKSLGTIRHIRAMWAFPQQNADNWRTGKDLGKWWSLAAVGAHCLDLVRWLANDDDDWSSFSSITANNVWVGPHDETAIIAAQLRSGPTVEVVSSVQFGPRSCLEIYGTNGSAICENTFGRRGAGAITLNGETLDFAVESPFVEQLRQLKQGIETGLDACADGTIGLRNVKDLLLVQDL
jgi:predicted dehydrogenase